MLSMHRCGLLLQMSVCLSVRLCVCAMVMTVSPAKTAEQIAMSFVGVFA